MWIWRVCRIFRCIFTARWIKRKHPLARARWSWTLLGELQAAWWIFLEVWWRAHSTFSDSWVQSFQIIRIESRDNPKICKIFLDKSWYLFLSISTRQWQQIHWSGTRIHKVSNVSFCVFLYGKPLRWKRKALICLSAFAFLAICNAKSIGCGNRILICG